MAKLQVLLLRARNLAAKDRNGLSDPFVRFQLGKTKAKSATVYKNLNPEWNEEFLFRVEDIENDVLEITLWDEDFLGMADFLGHVSIPVAEVSSAEGQNITRTWYTLTQKGDRPRDYYISGNAISHHCGHGKKVILKLGPVPGTRWYGEVELSFALWGALPHPSKNIYQSSFPAASFPRTSSVESAPAETGLTERSLSSDSETFPFSDSGGFSGDDGTPKADGASRAGPNPAMLGAAGRQGSQFSATRVFHSLRQTVSRNKFSTVVTNSASEGAAVLSSVSTLAANGVVKGASTGISAASEMVKTASSQFTAAAAQAVGAMDTSSSSSDTEGPPASGGVPGAAVSATWFETYLKDVPSAGELPGPYEGGVVLDQAFACPAHELNGIIFKPESEFFQEFATVRKISGLETGPWVQDAEGGATGAIHRTITYMTAPSALVKSVKATEEVRYTRADAGGYVVEACVSTPDVPYGNTFQTQMQFCITAQKDGTSHLRVAFRPHFFQSTMMKSMIENGMRTGIKETYISFLQVLSKYATPVGNSATEKAPESGRRGSRTPLMRVRDALLDLVVPFSCMLFVLSLVAVPWHIVAPNGPGWGGDSLRRWGIDLPDSFVELLTGVLLVLSAERAILRIRKFFLSQLFSKGDAGKKASGEGWFLTVTLVEGDSIGGANLRDLADPYVVFTCNGKTRTSSVKLQSIKPKWNETLTFDAFEDVPSMMEVEMFDYEGPFAEADLLGRAEVHLLKQSKEGLSDIWLPLEGRKAGLHGSRLHIRVQLSAQGGAAVPKIMEEISKETGRKLVTSAEKNVAFQKLFDLPEHEYLVNDFSCALKKSLLTQGRMFLSPRVLAFYANIFGKKTKFFLLWEDIEELKENAPSIASINRLLNPSVTVFVKKGKGGPDARLAAYGVDSQGRMKLRFQSFVRPSVAFRTIALLWRHRALPPEQQIRKVEEAQALLFPRSKSQAPQEQEDTAAFVGTEPPEVLVTTVNEVPVMVDQFLQVLRESNLMKKAHESMGHLNMEASEWVAAEGGGQQRNVKYALSRQHCGFGTNVSVVQMATRDMASDRPTWAQLEEVITLHDVPFGDHFNVEMKRQVRQKTATSSQLKVIVSIAWQKDTDPATKEKIKKDVSTYYKSQSQIIMAVIVREVVSAAQ